MLALKKYGHKNVDIIFFETGAHHKDNKRFIRECEEILFKKKIEIERNEKYKDLYDVLSRGFINSPGGAYCTHQLKKEVRKKLQKTRIWDNQIFGFEFERKEINRAIKFKEQNPETKPLFPLIEFKLNKKACITILESYGVRVPRMYELGYHNNNCIGCVKGGIGYWNKIRRDFPYRFKKMAEIEREVGATCLKEGGEEGSERLYLDTLDPDRGRELEPITGECGVVCATEFMEFMDDRVELILKGQLSFDDLGSEALG